ncbi:G-protein coupled receptor GRL101-like [Dendronephthya gigantea]|uniref:G-protein coupled receptor GRL101-like n=1 Tax=Dendronephthya gigantea TaxID=151771 RepID=UPI00106CFAE7|nr:G-protein coupled receptor GRL101-like [Dendronephthya gigantea]
MSLEKLDLYRNKIREIEPDSFRNLGELYELNIQRNKIRTLPEKLFDPLNSLQLLKVDDFTHCCAAQATKAGVECDIRHGDGLSDCNGLLKYTVLKYAIWVLGILALFGNLAVILWRVFTKDLNQVNSFLLTNLAVADLLMGVYLLILAVKDTTWEGVYYKHYFLWRDSGLCIVAGVIATISNEVSVFTLLVTTFDRLICIVFPFRFQRLSIKKVALIMAVVWSIGILLALAPLFDDAYFFDEDGKVNLFGQTSVCLPFMLSRERSAGWEYSVFVFVALNGFAFLCIAVAYAVIYRAATKAGNTVRSTRTKQDATIAKRMMFIILADFFCWFPVIVLSVMALTGSLYDPRQEVYAWTAVFVMPINSSVNPYIYTFSSKFVRDKIFGTASAQNVHQQPRERIRKSGRADGKPKFSGSYKTTGVVMTSTAGPRSSSSTAGGALETVNEGFTSDNNSL